MAIEGGIAFPEDIKDDSWLKDERFDWFRRGYEYAKTQTRSIPALATIPPEDLYFAVCSIVRGTMKDTNLAGFHAKLKVLAEWMDIKQDQGVIESENGSRQVQEDIRDFAFLLQKITG